MRQALTVMLLLALAAPACAGVEDELLMEVIAQETDLATRTKLNSDFVPGMVTILSGEEMEELGAQTVLDALSLVPGIQAFREKFGAPNLVVRGIAYPFNSGNTKVLVDGVSVSRDSAGVNSGALLTRIEQVERIEVFRGPSGSIHGAFAFAGVINIITRDKGGRAFAAAGSDDQRAAGAMRGWSEKAGRWKLSVNSGFYEGTDAEGPRGAAPHGSGSTSVFKAQRGRFDATVEQVTRDQDFRGAGGRRIPSDERTLALSARQRVPISREAEGELRLTYLDSRFSSLETGKSFDGDLVDLVADVLWKPHRKHNLLLRGQATREAIERGSLRLEGPPMAPPILSALALDTVRRIHAVSVQDQIDLSDRCALTLGVRFDDYSDVGSRGTPRAGLVYRASSRDIVKAQYSQGFRPPTFFEILAPGYSDDNLDFEVNSTTELGYVHRRPRSTTRITAFRSDIDHMLFLVLPPPVLPTFFRNASRAKTKGVEAEWAGRLLPRLTGLVNLSTADTFDTRSTSGPAGDSATAADWMGNLGLVYRPRGRLTLSSRLLHVGERHVITGKAPGYDRVDVTASVKDFPAKAWTFRAGVRNVTDDRVTYLLALPNATESVQFEPRAVWARAGVSF